MTNEDKLFNDGFNTNTAPVALEDVALSQEQIDSIKKQALINGLGQQYINAVQNQFRTADENVKRKLDFDKRIDEAKIDLTILCPFCNAEYSASMLDDLYGYASGGCDTCGPDTEIKGSIDIYCSNCKRMVYKKEYGK